MCGLSLTHTMLAEPFTVVGSKIGASIHNISVFIYEFLFVQIDMLLSFQNVPFSGTPQNKEQMIKLAVVFWRCCY